MGRILLSLLVMSVAVMTAAKDAATVEVLPYVKLHRVQDITLGQLLKISGIDKKLTVELEKVHLADGPKLGERRVFTSRALSKIIRKHIDGIRDEYAVKLIIPTQVIVENRGHELTVEQVTQKLQHSWEQLCSECQIKIKQLNLPVLPEKLKASRWSLVDGGRLPRGSFSVRLEIAEASHAPSRIFWVTGSAEIHKKVPVITRATPMGYRVQPDDIKMQTRDVTFAMDAIPSKEELIGKRTTRGFRAHDIMWRNSVEKEKALQRGQMVQVVAGSANFQITIQAKALQDAYIGDTVSLENVNTKKIISAVATNKGEVTLQ